MILALLFTVTLPETVVVGVFVAPAMSALIPAGSAVPLLTLPEWIAAKFVTEIDTPVTEDPMFWALMPLLAELMISPGEVLTMIEPRVELALIPNCDVPVSVAPP